MRIAYCLVLLIIISLDALSQQSLSNSRVSGAVTHVYRLSDKETELLINDPQSITDAFFHTLADSYSNMINARELPYGNYLRVRANKNNLEYYLLTCNNVSLSFVNNGKDFQFTLADQQGNRLTTTKVYTEKGKEIPYDQHSRLYVGRYPKRDGFIKVIHKGVTNYFTYESGGAVRKSYNRRSFSRHIKGFLLKPVKQWQVKKKSATKSTAGYHSFIVFSKPLYKPNDTVKFKAYILNDRGENIRTVKADVLLNGPNGSKKIGTVPPYMPGAYAYQFVLSDSLRLRLDALYTIQLTDSLTNELPVLLTSGSFRYEDYELKALKFHTRTDKNMHSIGTPIALYMKATDENELPVPDARVEIVARTQTVNAFYSDAVFVKDTLWVKHMPLDPVGETKLVLPDSIFPDAALSFSLHIRMLNSNNEVRTASQYLGFDARKIKATDEIAIKFIKDSLHFTYSQQGKEKAASGRIYKNTGSNVAIDSIPVRLPQAIVTDYRAQHYRLILDNGFDTTISLSSFTPEIQPVAWQKEDKLNLAVVNTHKIPFWYTVFSGNKELLKGYTTELDTVIKHAPRQAAHFRINYFWNEEEKSREISAFYNANQLDVKLLAPDVVYPGQQVNMKVRVMDAREQPVPLADITAYAHTSKFQSPAPSIPRFYKTYLQRKANTHTFESEEAYVNSSIKINWQKWGRLLALDTIAYYQFTNPRQMYTTTEPARDSITQFAPFVMHNGDFEPVNIIYVDEFPVFYYEAQQLQNYAFPITPGRHSIRLRTPNYEVWLDEMYFNKGVKTIFSIQADTANKRAQVVKKKNILSHTEAEIVNRHMIRVTDNFTGDNAFVQDDNARLWLNPPGSSLRGQDRLVGPLKGNMLYFQAAGLKHGFFKEPGYTYTFNLGLIKQKSYKGLYAFDTVLKLGHPLAEAYRQQVVRGSDYDSIWNEYLNLHSYTTQLFRNNMVYDTTPGRIRYKLDTAITNNLPYIKNVLVNNPAKPQNLLVLKGSDTAIPALPAGIYTLFFLLRDNRYFKIENLQVKPGGINYYYRNSIQLCKADSFSIKLDSSIKTAKGLTGGRYTIDVPLGIIWQFNSKAIDFSAGKNILSGQVIAASTKKPVANAAIMIEALGIGVTTDEKGFFKFTVPPGWPISVSAIGFRKKTVNAKKTDLGRIELETVVSHMEEVVVVGYATQKKVSVTGSIATVKSNDLAILPAELSMAIQGRVAGLDIKGDGKLLFIRGVSAGASGANPLLIVNGLPFSGNINDLSPDDIESLDVMKDASATAIYGAKAANGVLIIKTKTNNTIVNNAAQAAEQRLRTRFSDEGFWQPRLITDENGEASFTVTFPDDITQWRTRVIAINGRQQSGLLETSIKSFKTLSANFVSPQFAVDGDRINVIGKLMNYTPLPGKVLRILKYNNREIKKDSLTVTNAHIDSTIITVAGTDSLKFEYSLQQVNGYFDGELRSVPVYAAGVKETIGRFLYMDKDTLAGHTFEKDKGPGTLRAEASVFPVLLDEMRQLRDYEYLCNEQLASKLKSLLLEKKLRGYLKEPFQYEKHIREVMKKLNDNKSMQNLWGWWQGTQEEAWISLHVVEALLLAEQQGYTPQLNKNILYRYLLGKVVGAGAGSDWSMIRLLHRLDQNHNIKDWIVVKEADAAYSKQNKSLYEWMQMTQLKQMAGMPVNIDTLLRLKRSSMFGGIYWGEERYYFWNNSIQNTLLAYRILKAAGGYDNELGRIRQYFLEQRRNGQWRNTYESSLILETLLPDLFNSEEKPRKAALAINGERIEAFPFEKKFAAGETLLIHKSGDMPVYVTAYQQFQNSNPQKVSKDFDVRSYFVQDAQQVTYLKAGKKVTLRVEVTARADAEYVMVEVPVPAGCSYETKLQRFWGVETHREYFRNKTSVFCTRLTQGKHVFDIELMPRYSGNYTLNPAKAEMMYFPVFYGREEIKKVQIE